MLFGYLWFTKMNVTNGCYGQMFYLGHFYVSFFFSLLTLYIENLTEGFLIAFYTLKISYLCNFERVNLVGENICQLLLIF